MKISNRLETILINRSFSFRSPQYSSRKSTIYDTDVNTRFVRTINEGDTFIVPTFMMSDFAYPYLRNNEIRKNIVYPMSIGCPYYIKSVDSIVSYILKNNIRLDSELIKIISEKYGTYYGTEGLILNSEFEILLLNVCKCTVEDRKVHVNELITYVHPKVSLSDNGMDKHIYTKIIPTYLNSSIYNSIPNNEEVIRHVPVYTKPTVLFKDVTDTFLIKPIEPTVNTDEDIYDILSNNIDDLLETVTKCH